MNSVETEYRILDREFETQNGEWLYGIRSTQYIPLSKSFRRCLHYRKDGYYYTFFNTSEITWERACRLYPEKYGADDFWMNPDYDIKVKMGHQNTGHKTPAYREFTNTGQFIKNWEKRGKKILTVPKNQVY